MPVQPSRLDPAADAARLLGRLGFAILMIAAPLAAVGGRRALVIMVPIAVVLIVLATFIETDGREPWQRAKAMILTPSGGLALFLLFWAGLSLVWTPFPQDAAERLANVIGSAALLLLCVAALPRRMRASNVYFLPLGIAITAGALIALALRADTDSLDDGHLAQRAALLITMMMPAAITWLAMRGKMIAGWILLALVVSALWLVDAYWILAALVIGAFIYGLALRQTELARRLVLAGTAGLVLLAPLVPLVLRPITKLIFGVQHVNTEAIRVWARVVTQEPARLITGHGFDTALRARSAGLVPAGSPRGLLFELWYELGLLGAIAFALLLWRAVAATSQLPARDSAAVLSLMSIAFALALLGQNATQAWWMFALLIAMMALVAVQRAHERALRLSPSSTVQRP